MAEKDVVLSSVETTIEDQYESKLGSPFKDLSGKYSRISELHVRSFVDKVISKFVLWADEFGNKLMAANVKGRVPYDEMPYLEIDKYSDLGVRVHWMCDSTDVDKIEEVSEFMRKNGLPTERIRKKSKIEKIQIRGVWLSIEELKQQMLANVVDTEKKAIYADYLDKVDFFELERELPVDERVHDLTIKNDRYGKKMKVILKSAFTYLKMAEGIDLNVDDDEDIKLFITNILPTRMGEYLGKFHKLGLRHTYPGEKNWTLVGCLVDLDSVNGPHFGGEASTNWEIEQDLTQSIRAISALFLNQVNSKEGYLWKFWRNDVAKHRQMENTSMTAFLKAYMKTSGVSRDFIVSNTDPDDYDQAVLLMI